MFEPATSLQELLTVARKADTLVLTLQSFPSVLTIGKGMWAGNLVLQLFIDAPLGALRTGSMKDLYNRSEFVALWTIRLRAADCNMVVGWTRDRQYKGLHIGPDCYCLGALWSLEAYHCNVHWQKWPLCCTNYTSLTGMIDSVTVSPATWGRIFTEQQSGRNKW